MNSRFHEEGVVLFRRDLGSGYFVLGIEAPNIAAAAEPGQFAMLSALPVGSPSKDPLLARPFTFLRAQEGRIEFFIHQVGRGTSLLAQCSPGDRFRVLGPLGIAFRLPAEPSAQAIFVAGGIGVAPFLHFSKLFTGRPLPVLLYGGRSANDLKLIEELDSVTKLEISTEDGSRGVRGRVTVLLEKWLSGNMSPEVYTCGPEKMMEVVTRMTPPSVTVQASLEARMACGLGICRGCAVKSHQGNLMKICVEGPVVDGHEVWK